MQGSEQAQFFGAVQHIFVCITKLKPMTPFTKDYVRFLKDLAANNNREWFHANKKRYEESVKKPFELFVQELIDQVGRKDKKVQITPKEAMFRIHRDVRFSKDKTPYKTNMSAVINRGGRKDMHSPGMYVELSPEHVRVYGGLYMLSSEELKQVRIHLSKNAAKFKKLYSDKKFRNVFGEVRGEQHKRAPKEFASAIEKEPLILNKQFYYFSQEKPSLIAKKELTDVIMEHYATMKPMGEFLFAGLK